MELLQSKLCSSILNGTGIGLMCVWQTVSLCYAWRGFWCWSNNIIEISCNYWRWFNRVNLSNFGFLGIGKVRKEYSHRFMVGRSYKYYFIIKRKPLVINRSLGCQTTALSGRAGYAATDREATDRTIW